MIAQTQSYDVASGSVVVASSTYTAGPCAYNNCGGFQVVNNSPLGTDVATGQWVSAPGSCEPNRNETLTLDWSSKYNTQLLTEVRFRYGDLEGEYLVFHFTLIVCANKYFTNLV
jgi:hypothetical protein